MLLFFWQFSSMAQYLLNVSLQRKTIKYNARHSTDIPDHPHTYTCPEHLGTWTVIRSWHNRSYSVLITRRLSVRQNSFNYVDTWPSMTYWRMVVSVLQVKFLELWITRHSRNDCTTKRQWRHLTAIFWTDHGASHVFCKMFFEPPFPHSRSQEWLRAFFELIYYFLILNMMDLQKYMGRYLKSFSWRTDTMASIKARSAGYETVPRPGTQFAEEIRSRSCEQ